MTAIPGQAADIFAEAAALPPDRRDEFLAARCGQDASLRAEICALLAHHDRAEDFLDSRRIPAFSAAIGVVTEESDAARALIGARIAGYRITELLGRGGMGAVYRAEQERPRRAVAIKLIHPDVLSVGTLRRFAAEAEALGRLHHPGIAQIIEAGSAVIEPFAGAPTPYIAMEYVPGRPLTQYAAESNASTRQIIELLIQICMAVQHAHQRGVIHRDLKPANILVIEESGNPGQGSPDQDETAVHSMNEAPARPAEGRALAKILDFGVARFVDHDPSETLLTAEGHFIGTLAYMSPEQVSGPAGDIDTRCDIYAMGVILYQLLTGETPIDLTGRSLPDAIRAIAEATPRKLGEVRRAYRGDLETIVARAMEKDRERRYSSAGALAEDLRRCLTGEAIEARRDSTLYVLSRGLRRHRGMVAVAAAAAIGLTAFAVYATVEAERLATANRNEREAKQRESDAARLALQAAATADAEAAKARAVSDFLKTVIELASPGPGAGYGRSLVDALDDTSQRVADGALAGQPEVEAKVRLTLANTYAHLFLNDPVGRHLQWLLEYDRVRFGENSPRYLETLRRLGEVQCEVNLLAESEANLRRGLRLTRETFGADSLEAMRYANRLGNCLMRQNKNTEAFSLNQEATDGTARLTGEDSVATAIARFNLAGVLRNQRRTAEALTMYERVRPILSNLPEDPVTTIRFRRYYVRDTQLNVGRASEAEQSMRDVLALAVERLGPDHPETLNAGSFLALCLRANGKTEEAIALLANNVQVFSRIRRSMPGGEPEAVLELSDCLLSLKRFDEAEDLLRRELKRLDSLCGPDDGRTLRFLDRSAAKLRRDGRREAALGNYEALASRGERRYGSADKRVQTWRKAAAALRTPSP